MVCMHDHDYFVMTVMLWVEKCRDNLKMVFFSFRRARKMSAIRKSPLFGFLVVAKARGKKVSRLAFAKSSAFNGAFSVFSSERSFSYIKVGSHFSCGAKRSRVGQDLTYSTATPFGRSALPGTQTFDMGQSVTFFLSRYSSWGSKGPQSKVYM